jgi:PKD repeat protein
MKEHRLQPRMSGRRRAVAGDTVIILGGAVVAAIIAQLAMGGGQGAGQPTETPPSSEIVVGVGTGGPGPTIPPLPTIGQIVNPSVAIDATPTPIPIITLGPPTPSPSATVAPSATTKPTPKPTAKPSAPPTPAPTPDVAFVCNVNGLDSYELDCSQTNSAYTTSWIWKWGDGMQTTNGPSDIHHYAPGSDNCYPVSLTAAGPGGTVPNPTPQNYAIGPLGSC